MRLSALLVFVALFCAVLPAQVSFKGRVVSRADGKPLAGLELTLREVNPITASRDLQTLNLKTAADGTFDWKGKCASNSRFVLWLENDQWGLPIAEALERSGKPLGADAPEDPGLRLLPFVVPTAKGADMGDIKLVAGGSVTFRATNSVGEPLEGNAVLQIPGPTILELGVVPCTKGAVTVRGLPIAAFRFTVRGKSDWAIARNFQVEEGKVLDAGVLATPKKIVVPIQGGAQAARNTVVRALPMPGNPAVHPYMSDRGMGAEVTHVPLPVQPDITLSKGQWFIEVQLESRAAAYSIVDIGDEPKPLTLNSVRGTKLEIFTKATEVAGRVRFTVLVRAESPALQWLKASVQPGVDGRLFDAGQPAGIWWCQGMSSQNPIAPGKYVGWAITPEDVIELGAIEVPDKLDFKLEVKAPPARSPVELRVTKGGKPVARQELRMWRLASPESGLVPEVDVETIVTDGAGIVSLKTARTGRFAVLLPRETADMSRGLPEIAELPSRVIEIRKDSTRLSVEIEVAGCAWVALQPAKGVSLNWRVLATLTPLDLMAQMRSAQCGTEGVVFGYVPQGKWRLGGVRIQGKKGLQAWDVDVVAGTDLVLQVQPAAATVKVTVVRPKAGTLELMPTCYCWRFGGNPSSISLTNMTRQQFSNTTKGDWMYYTTLPDVGDMVVAVSLAMRQADQSLEYFSGAKRVMVVDPEQEIKITLAGDKGAVTVQMMPYEVAQNRMGKTGEKIVELLDSKGEVVLYIPSPAPEQDGKTECLGVTPGTYTVRVRRFGHRTLSQQVVVKTHETSKVEFKPEYVGVNILAVEGFNLNRQLLALRFEDASGKVVAGSGCALNLDSWDAKMRFVLPVTQSEVAQVRVLAPGFKPVVFKVAIDLPEDVEVTVKLER